MEVPSLRHPELYQGLYLFDFGDHVSVGYTAEEIDVLLRSPDHRDGRAYKIHHANAAGELSLRGMSRLDTAVEEAMIFYRGALTEARSDFEKLKQSAVLSPPPTPLHWHLACGIGTSDAYFTILIYSSAYTEAVGRWLNHIRFAGGDTVEGGVHIARWYESASIDPLERLAIAPEPKYHSRPRKEVLATVDRVIQREL